MAALKGCVSASCPVRLWVWVYAGEYGCTCLWSYPHTCGWHFWSIYSTPFSLSGRTLWWVCDPPPITAWERAGGNLGGPTGGPECWAGWTCGLGANRVGSMMTGLRLQSWLFYPRQWLNLTTLWFLHLKARGNNTHVMLVMNIKNKMDSASHIVRTNECLLWLDRVSKGCNSTLFHQIEKYLKRVSCHYI